MEYEITEDGMFAIKNASLALNAQDILGLAAENFKDDFVHDEEYYLIQAKEVDDDDFTNWFFIAKGQWAEFSRRAKARKG